MSRTHLLIDGDVIAFVAAAAAQDTLMDSFGYVQPFAYSVKGEAVLENILWSLSTELKAQSREIVLSDPESNWRHTVDPNYKRNRTDNTRPLLLEHLKQYLRDKHGAEHWPHLEADDVLSIKMTDPDAQGDDYKCVKGHDRCDGETGFAECPTCERFELPRLVCVGRDKDFKSIPGLHHSWKQDVASSGAMLTREVSPWEAERWHLIQTLAGDRIDGFEGCPGIGIERASRIIDTPVRLVPQEGVKTRGVNKGEAVTRWMAEPTRDYWACIVSHYRKAGLTEDDALRTARLARLLRHGEYDRETESVTLWTPDKITRGQSVEDHLSHEDHREEEAP